MISGLGCAVLMLVGALLVGLGVFRVGAFCSAAGEHEQVGQDLQLHAYEFGDALHRGDYRRAYGMLDESTQDTISEDEFVDEVSEYESLLAASPPFPVAREQEHLESGVCDAGDPSEVSRWRLSTQFAGPKAEEILQMELTSEGRNVDGEIKDQRVVEWQFRKDTRDVEDDGYVWSAIRFHRALNRGDYREAQRVLSVHSELDRFDRDLLAEQVSPITVGIDDTDDFRFGGVYPERHVDVLTVRMILEGDDEDLYVDYKVDWRHDVYDFEGPEPFDGALREQSGDVELEDAEALQEVEADEEDPDADEEDPDAEVDDDEEEGDQGGGGGPQRPTD